MIIDMKEIPVVIMCGGLGKRMESITKNEIPKCMLDVNGKPFLHRLIEKVRSYGVRHFILCLGFKGSVIEEYCRDTFLNTNLHIGYSYDKHSLQGTTKTLIGIKGIFPLKYKVFLVMNGDTYFGVNLDEWVRNCVESYHVLRYYGCSYRVYFKGLDSINSGIYFLNTNIFNILNSDSPSNLEDTFRELLMRSMFIEYRSSDENENLLIDIGTSKGYEEAKKYFKNHI